MTRTASASYFGFASSPTPAETSAPASANAPTSHRLRQASRSTSPRTGAVASSDMRAPNRTDGTACQRPGGRGGAAAPLLGHAEHADRERAVDQRRDDDVGPLH